MDTPVETELKLAAAPAMLEALRGHPRLAGPEQRIALTSSYFDTPGGSLHRGGGSLRLRTSDAGTEQTLKLPRSADRVISRAEWTVPAPSGRLDLALFPAAARSGLEALIGAAPLACYARTLVERTTRQVQFGQSAIEVAFDQGAIHARERVEPLCEIELELKAGRRVDLFALALALPLGPDLTWRVASKSGRAQALAYDLPQVARRAAPVSVPPAASLGEAVRAIGWNGLEHLLANYPLVLSSADPEAVHQARVALRRLRAMLDLFAPGPLAPVFSAEWKAVADGLAAPRDLHLLHRRIAAGPASPGLLAELAARQDRALATARDMLAGSPFQQLLNRFAMWLEAPDGVAAEARADRAFGRRAEAALTHQLARVNRGPRRLDRMPQQARHKLRIAAKTLRYALQFCAPAGPDEGSAKRLNRLGRALERLQDALGQLNDIAFAADPPDSLFAGTDPITAARLAAELSGLVKRQRHGRGKLLRKAQRARDRLRHADLEGALR